MLARTGRRYHGGALGLTTFGVCPPARGDTPCARRYGTSRSIHGGQRPGPRGLAARSPTGLFPPRMLSNATRARGGYGRGYEFYYRLLLRWPPCASRADPFGRARDGGRALSTSSPTAERFRVLRARIVISPRSRWGVVVAYAGSSRAPPALPVPSPCGVTLPGTACGRPVGRTDRSARRRGDWRGGVVTSDGISCAYNAASTLDGPRPDPALLRPGISGSSSTTT